MIYFFNKKYQQNNPKNFSKYHILTKKYISQFIFEVFGQLIVAFVNCLNNTGAGNYHCQEFICSTEQFIF